MTTPPHDASEATDPGWAVDRNSGDSERGGTHPGVGTAGPGSERHAGAPERRLFPMGRRGRRDRNDPDRNDARSAPGGTDAPGDALVPVDPARARFDDAADGPVPVGKGRRLTGTLTGRLRFVNDDVSALNTQLRFAWDSSYNMRHVPVVRAANVAFFFLVTAPVLTIVFFLLWAFAVLLHRALTGVAIIVLTAPFANQLWPWLVPDVLDVTTWTRNAWQLVGIAVLVFGVATAIALAAGRRR